MNRRHFITATATAAGLAAMGFDTHAARDGADLRTGRSDLIDVNVHLSRWPLRRVRGDDTGELVAMLRRHGVVQAWAGTLDGLLHKDIAAANARLVDECHKHGRGLLVPFGSINPKLPDWEEELRRCAEGHRMPGIRLHPNYHGYTLDDPVFARLLRTATEHRLVVQLAAAMEDDRMMHPLFRVDPVDMSPLAGLVRQTPGVRLLLLNALRTARLGPLLDLTAAGEVYLEISMLEGVAGIENLPAQVQARRLLFGSHAPLFYFDSALLKLKESAVKPEDLRAIRHDNAQRLLAKTL